VRFQLPSWLQGKPRRSVTALAAGMILAAASLTLSAAAQAQSFTWGSATPTTDYNSGTNWTPSGGAPPIAAGQSAVFDVLGFATVVVNVGPIAPDSWTFNAASQPSTISGAAVNFSRAGPTGGIIDNATAGQFISISNNIGESVAGVQVQQLGNGMLILSGVNTYSGGTKVSGTGIVQVTNNSSLGTGTVTLETGEIQAGAGGVKLSNNFKINNTAQGSALDEAGVTLTISGNITDGSGGSGKLYIYDSLGGGAVRFTATNTYSGGTTICGCATLLLGNAAHTGSIVGAVTNNGAFNIVNANTAGITSILNENGGSTRFLNTSSASSINITNNTGTTFFGTTGATDTNTAGNATIDNNNGGTFFEAHSNAGAAKITNHDGGVTIFDDHASAASATITNNNNGFTEFGLLSTAGNATIITNSGGSVTFFDTSTGGNAQFITNGTGIVDFGGSLGPSGDGRITAGSIAGSGTYYIGAGNLLTVGSNNLSTEVSGVIADFNPCACGTGPGNLEKVGTGTLTLSGINTYTGSTSVNRGTLLVTGSIASSAVVLVGNGATLGGTGTVPLTALSGGAVLAPGLPNALGTLTVTDLLSFCSCSFYDVKLTSTGNDLTKVVAGLAIPGLASLAGTVRVTSLNGRYRFNSPYTILTAQGGFGPTLFNSLVTPTGINGSLSYTTTDVNLTLLSALGQLPGLNVNQHNVANALDAAFNSFGSSGGLSTIFNGNMPQNISQAAGETATGSQQATFNAMNLFMVLLTDPFIDGRGASGSPSGGATPFAEESDPMAYAAKRQNNARDAFAKIPTKAEAARSLLDPHWSVWGAAYGGGATTDGNAVLGSNSATARAFGFVAGADYRISPATLAGFALAGGGTNFSVNGFGTGRSDLFQAGAFVRHNIGAAYVSGALAYGWQDVTTDRTVTVAGLDRLHAEFNANAYSGRIEGGYRYVTPWMGVTPYAAGQFTTFSLPAYAEQVLAGTGNFALNYSAKDVTASRSELGVRTDRSFAMQNAILTLRGRFAWAHDFNTDRNISAVFQTLPGAAFVVNGAAQSHDSALTTASAEMKWLNGWSAAVAFEGEFSDVTKSYAGKGVVRYTW
jgi:autotransporter-associated beta strand protein